MPERVWSSFENRPTLLAMPPRELDTHPGRASRAVALFSISLLFFSVPHVLEDFALGEPQQRGVPGVVIATVVSSLLAAQALALYWLGQQRRAGIAIHALLGLLWPAAAGAAQLPLIVGPEPYRSGPVSVTYVLGIVVVGLGLFVSAILALRRAPALRA